FCTQTGGPAPLHLLLQRDPQDERGRDLDPKPCGVEESIASELTPSLNSIFPTRSGTIDGSSVIGILGGDRVPDS
ncbi:MAG TPA: hypothetical protein VNA87_02560, partial [Actinomycetota bacterium]|nr:hypothetical protein [Actinomycetota bacterium]